jgi:hypothetical protein
LVLNQTLAIRGVTNTGQDDFVLDKAFALIEGLEEVGWTRSADNEGLRIRPGESQTVNGIAGIMQAMD